jgi:Tol biopolymer transport system component
MADRVGPYELRERLGAGGMGVVYRSRDTQLDRWVAIKILSAAAVADPDRLLRFVQEAKSASAISHPNIATIHQLGATADQHYIVMELVQGETLRERVRRGPLAIPMVLDIGIQAAEGLASAHAAGVIHRDLKPENLMLRPDGIVKILDFGLAKLVQAHEPWAWGGGATTGDETIAPSRGAGPSSPQPTTPGLVLGTVGYMAPEQVRGAAVDARADLFALGCVLYELATGARAFGGDSPIETLHAILKEPVRALHDVRSDAPAELERILRKCLAKDPDERYQSARDLAIDLRALRRDLDSGATTAASALPSGVTRAVGATSGSTPGSTAAAGRRWLRKVVAVSIVAAAIGIPMLLRGVRRDAVTPPTGLKIARLTSTGNADWPALSPDGRWVAYVRADVGRYSIWLRQIATSAEAEHVPAGDDPIGALVFTPDSNWLYYVVAQRGSLETSLYRIPVVGGAPRLVYDDVDSPISFSPDGTQMVFSRFLPPLACEMYVGDADGSTPPRRILERGPDFLSLAQWSPDGRTIAAAALDTRDVSRVRLASFPAGGGRLSVDDEPWGSIRGLAWMPDGSGFFVAGTQNAQDPVSRLFRVRVRSGAVQPITTDLNSYASVSVSADGKTLVSLRGSSTTNFWRMPVSGDPARDTAAASQIGYGTARIDWPAPSPDGTAIVYSSDEAGHTDLWWMKLDGTGAHALSAGPASELQADWSPDGRRIAYTVLHGDSARVWVMNADGTGARQVVFGIQSGAPDWGPDSRTIAYHQMRDAESSVWKLDVDGGTPQRLSNGPASFPQWSPQGTELLCFTFDTSAAQPKPAMAVLPVAGGTPRPLAIAFDTESFHRAWSPDGAHVTGIGTEGGASNLVDYPIAGGAPRSLTQFGPGLRIFGFAWLPDGSGLVLRRGISNRDVVLLQDF